MPDPWVPRPKPGMKVLDIGSGPSPERDATILLEKYIEDRPSGGGDHVTKDRPIVCGDVCYLPFKDKSIDFIWCNQVIEHVDDPARACEEMMRVGKKGYIEAPHPFSEFVDASREYHKWYVWNDGQGLCFKKKTSFHKIRNVDDVGEYCRGLANKPESVFLYHMLYNAFGSKDPRKVLSKVQNDVLGLLRHTWILWRDDFTYRIYE